MKYYNTKIIDFGNGEKQVITFKNPVALQEEDGERVRIDKSVLSEFNPVVDLNPPTEEELERKALHSFFSSSNRTKREIYKIARANTWEYFITFTFDSKKVKDRTDYSSLLKKVTEYFHGWRRFKAPELRYLLIPEQHKKIEDNGLHAWHFHGLIAGTDGLTFIPLSDAEKKYYDIDYSDEVYRIKEYKLGFCTATKVQSNDRVSSYITKYITKSMCAVSKNKKRYVCSRNLNRPCGASLFLSGLQRAI